VGGVGWVDASVPLPGERETCLLRGMEFVLWVGWKTEKERMREMIERRVRAMEAEIQFWLGEYQKEGDRFAWSQITNRNDVLAVLRATARELQNPNVEFWEQPPVPMVREGTEARKEKQNGYSAKSKVGEGD
jgi:hypothetical protein